MSDFKKLQVGCKLCKLVYFSIAILKVIFTNISVKSCKIFCAGMLQSAAPKCK